ncbi:MAG: MFS transporter [Devosiaceae bacterium]|nr:MFS transporter [Devosiaceae bacterium MH13]
MPVAPTVPPDERPVASRPETVEAGRLGPWSPLRHKAFALLWFATVLSLTGTWMNDMGAAWLMGQLHPSPAMVALTQAATTAPVFCFALLAGVLADRYDRRALMLILNVAMGGVAGALATLVILGEATPARLLALTFLLNTGAAFLAPVWLAVVPSLVPRATLPEAFALNSLAINIARAIGPAVAGLVIAAIGLWGPFALNAVTFAVITAAVLAWRPGPTLRQSTSPDKRESLSAALGDLFRFARGSRAFRGVLHRAGLFFLAASCLWALLPVLIRDHLALGANAFGLAMGAIGLGAVLGAFGLPKLRAALPRPRLVAVGAAVTAVVMFGLALSKTLPPVLGWALIAGAGWIAVLSTFHIWVQTLLDEPMRGRGTALFLTVFFGGMALGSLGWGVLASASVAFGGAAFALIAAAAALLLFAIIGWVKTVD